MLKLICGVICFLLVISGFVAPASAQNTQHTIEEPVAGLTQADSQQINTEHTTEYTQARTHQDTQQTSDRSVTNPSQGDTLVITQELGYAALL